MLYNIGSSGDEVKRIQTALENAGYATGGIDGIYGDMTANAVRKYQTDNGLTVDGITGSETMGSLFKSPSIPNMTVSQSTATPTPTAPTVDITGLTGLRDYGTGKGLTIGYNGVPTVNGNPVDTSGLVMKDDRYYGTLDQLNNIFSPYEAPKAYVSPYESKINAALDKFLNYDPDKPYNVTADPLYAPLKEQYESAGKSAFNNQIGRLSALTGGRPSTAAVGTATGAQNEYAQQFSSSVLPQLVQQAYQRGQDKFNNLAQQLKILQGVDDTGYGRYRDTVGDYQVDRNYNRGVLEFDKNFDRGVLETDRNYDRGILESDRNYNRDILESDRNYNRDVLESDRSFAESKAKAAANQPQELSDMGNSQQIMYYNNAFSYLLKENGGDGYKAYQQLLRESADYNNSMGGKLYNYLAGQLLDYAKSQGTATNTANNRGLTYTDYFNEASKRMKQTGDMDEPLYTPEDIFNYINGLPLSSADKDRLANDLGLPQ